MAKKERPALTGFRLYKRHRTLVRAKARKEKVSGAEIVRRAIEVYTA